MLEFSRLNLPCVHSNSSDNIPDPDLGTLNGFSLIRTIYQSVIPISACDLNSAKSLHWVPILNTYIETEDCEIFLGVVSRSDCHLTARPRNHSALRPLSEILPTTPRCSKKFYFLILVRAEFLCSQLWKPHHGITTMGFYPKTLIICWDPKYRHYT